MDVCVDSPGRGGRRVLLACSVAGFFVLAAGCATPPSAIREADEVAAGIIAAKQMEALGRTEPFTVQRPEDTLRRRLLGDEARAPSARSRAGPARTPSAPLVLSLTDALKAAAGNSRAYQERKEDVFLAALSLDLERDRFRNTWGGEVSGELTTDGSSGERVTGTTTSGSLSFSRLLKSGLSFTTALGVDLVRLLTQGGEDSLGIVVDATATLPLLKGAGRDIAAEGLTQAERETVYAIWNFERFKRTFAVQVATDYLGVLQSENRLENTAQNYRSLIASTNRARRLADAGRLPEIQFDQAVQQELTARSRWIAARAEYENELDAFKVTLGLPPDAEITLDPAELDRLAEDLGHLAGSALEGPRVVPPADREVVLEPPSPLTGEGMEMDEAGAMAEALRSRLDLAVALGRVEDARRRIAVAASDLKPGLDLTLSASAGEARSLATADSPDARVDLSEGTASALLSLELPFERTAERKAYRESVLVLDQTLREAEEVTDTIKQQVRGRLRDLLLARETVSIQARAVATARRRVGSTDLFLQAGRAEIRDVLESQEALLAALNGLTGSYIAYRLSELRLQRDMGVLQVDEKGLWTEFSPGKETP